MRRLKLMIFDVDGVLTDGTLYFSETGAELKAFNARDGHGIKMLKESGVEIAILSARRSRAVDARAAELGITLVVQGAEGQARGVRKPDRPGARFGRGNRIHGRRSGGFAGLSRCGFAASVPGRARDRPGARPPRHPRPGRPRRRARDLRAHHARPEHAGSGHRSISSHENPRHSSAPARPDGFPGVADALAAICRARGRRRRLASSQATSPDAIVENFTIQNLDASGQAPVHVLGAEDAAFSPTTVPARCSIRASSRFRPSGGNYVATANRGTINRQNEEAFLYGNVLVLREATRRRAGTSRTHGIPARARRTGHPSDEPNGHHFRRKVDSDRGRHDRQQGQAAVHACSPRSKARSMRPPRK